MSLHPAQKKRYYGKYQGQVINNLDDKQMGRVQVTVPAVTGEQISTWAMPCVPAAGIQAGLFIVPAIGSKVWIEYEQGDPDYPIWTGGYWGSAAEVPPLALAAPPGLQNILLQTTQQNTLLITDTPGPQGGIVLKSTGGSMLIVNDTGIYLTNGAASITLIGNTVAVNETALTVM